MASVTPVSCCGTAPARSFVPVEFLTPTKQKATEDTATSSASSPHSRNTISSASYPHSRNTRSSTKRRGINLNSDGEEVDDLKKTLTIHGLATKGLKLELQTRLQNFVTIARLPLQSFSSSSFWLSHPSLPEATVKGWWNTLYIYKEDLLWVWTGQRGINHKV